MELYALDGNLRKIGVIEYESLIWIERFNRVGTCEVYAPLTERNKNLLLIGNYIFRTDSSNVCLIRDIKIQNNPDTGTFITALGYDAKFYLDTRINNELEIFASDMASADLELLVYNALTESGPRKLTMPNGNPLFYGRGQSDIPGAVNQSVFGLSYGAIVRQIMGDLGCGYRVTISQYTPYGTQLQFGCDAGLDKSATVVFSRSYNNLGDCEYEKDIRNVGNCVYVYNPELSYMAQLGEAESTDRIEKWLETNTQKEMAYGSIKDFLSATWSLRQSGDITEIRATGLYIPILSSWQLARLQAWHSGSTTAKDGYYYISGTVTIATAEIQSSSVTDDTNFTLIDPIYDFVENKDCYKPKFIEARYDFFSRPACQLESSEN